ncbi:MAG: helix-turn-helix domain-containing protein [Oculatellaceae cyanobacterium Prado106]|jgi:transcriptional regulator with XRE-family HTH domain|nr:helix-turn-helix domain-containing protein [Oculatellaceae cyanobacterium Prado106]
MGMISKIAGLRERAGLTQRELSQVIGVTETTIANWERGRSGLEWIDRLIKLCKTLDCELTDLIDYESEAEPEIEPTFEELRQMYKAGKLKKVGSQPK